jgi:hypothetical protein
MDRKGIAITGLLGLLLIVVGCVSESAGGVPSDAPPDAVAIAYFNEINPNNPDYERAWAMLSTRFVQDKAILEWRPNRDDERAFISEIISDGITLNFEITNATIVSQSGMEATVELTYDSVLLPEGRRSARSIQVPLVKQSNGWKIDGEVGLNLVPMRSPSKQSNGWRIEGEVSMYLVPERSPY